MSKASVKHKRSERQSYDFLSPIEIRQICQSTLFIFLWLLRIYKLTLSPFLGPCCRFYPSCADYAYEALANYGIIKGGWLSVKRLCRCHPFCQGGIDLVPSKSSLTS